MFDELAKNVMTKRKNFGAPENMMLKDMVETKDMFGKTITIDNIIVRNKLKVDKDTKEVIKSKKGEDIYQTVVYIAFDGDKFFATKSALIIEEIKMITNTEIVFREKKDIEITDFNGKKVKIGAGKVKYADKKEYDQPIFVDA